MLRTGWRPGQGLGAHGQGMATPLEPQHLPARPGLGYLKQAAAVTAHDAAMQAARRTRGLRRHRAPRQRAASKLHQDRADRSHAWHTTLSNLLLAQSAEDEEPEHQEQAAGDIWLDQPTLKYLETMELDPTLDSAQLLHGRGQPLQAHAGRHHAPCAQASTSSPGLAPWLRW